MYSPDAYILSNRALAPVGQIANLAIRFQQAHSALKGLNEIVERPIERDQQRNYSWCSTLPQNSVPLSVKILKILTSCSA